MASYYPHKQTVIIAIVCIVVVGAVFTYVKTIPRAPATAQQPSSTDNIAVTAPDLLATSTDWRSSFFGEYGTSTPKIYSQTDKRENLTLTDRFGRDFFARYIQLKQSGLIDNEQFVTDTINQSIYTAAQSAQHAKTYTLMDIVVINNTDTSHLKAYGNAIGSTISTYGVDDDPAQIANSAFDANDMTILARIEPIVKSYDTIVSVLKNIPVPQPLAIYHTDLMNAVSGMAKIATDIRYVESDPMQTMVSVSTYSSMQTKLIESLKNMKSYFSITNISFDATEPGSIFSSAL